MKILVTGVAGFIGMHVAISFLERGDTVIGIDSMNKYYDRQLKLARLKKLKKFKNFIFGKMDITNKKKIINIFDNTRLDRVVHLAAQAGIRYSITNPEEYIKSNLIGFANILENCRNFKIKHLVYASSSSVYGLNTLMPFKESHSTNHPVSLYAASKKSNELLAHSYSHLYGLPTTGLRFFTVYGPWSRPDMALFKFTKSIIENKPLDVFNSGKMLRDFTYIDDITKAVVKSSDKIAIKSKYHNSDKPNPSISSAPFRIFNIGNDKPTSLIDYIKAIEHAVGKKAKMRLLDFQPGDVASTFSDTSQLNNWINFKPNTPIRLGVKKFVQWFREFYKV